MPEAPDRGLSRMRELDGSGRQAAELETSVRSSAFAPTALIFFGNFSRKRFRCPFEKNLFALRITAEFSLIVDADIQLRYP